MDYTFTPTSDGNIQVSQGGKNVSVGDASNAARYGYTAPTGANPNSAGAGEGNFGKPSLLVTSGSSRTQYADNVGKMNTALTGISQSGTSTTGTGLPTGTTKSNSYSLDAKGNIISADGSSVATKDASGGYSSVSNSLGQKLTGLDANGNLIFGGVTTTPTDTLGGDSKASTDTGLDPVVTKQYNDTITASDQVLQQRTADLEAAKATLANDPAAAAALDSIKHKYDVLIQAMRDKNKILIGSQTANAARNGSLQYANEMESNFMSEEMDHANERITNLVNQEQDLLLKTTLAYKTGDVKALGAAQAAYDKANASKLKAIGDLVKATNEHVKSVQAQQKIDAASSKQKITDDIRLSISLGKTIADSIKESGITDPAQIDQYIQSMAAGSNISNPDILKSAVVKAQQDQSKLDLSATNTANVIKNRDAGTKIKQQNANKPKAPSIKGGGTDGGYKYTADDVASYTSLLNKGGTGPDGAVFAPRGSDSFVDPGAYVAALNDWVNNNGTPAGFAKKFPVKDNVNPDSYSSLPAAIQPKVKTTASAANPPK